ncbi:MULTISPECIES: ubiquinol-cytochrome c reductase iron-sulfur subunit [Rhodopseudomonas]|uniref:Ubiquinol-cytochrome c reductase iron-sulfur subunit n=1 Tax=Rhodopseudomonas palustris TaxID=1076 RepID=A0A0D7EF96_RHOPL|nr:MULTISPECIES: ubiquinol-cytochrome c reductase iron-sulfur subunit [Rhodopseudomonas]KIZ39316.1 ubiquinol-cytochrome C reductase [Rhodopseudomonas palustris]MDF3810912.1 ubiquinol-cytochrome c reductase iron-sulfur subunit [Rhodopseudomonas sp. BAL398]WOK19887.1 ubiquinol-cytochrome c reductase iron-sulfur subunit [Rhodopseudomonas sp. BAL398]
MQSSTDSLPATDSSDHQEPTRRDFLFIATGAFAAVGAVAAIFPFVSQMEPDAATLAAGAPIDYDLSHLEPGQQIVVRWRNRPIFITNRTPQSIKTLQDPKLIARLSDPNSSERQQPDYADNWHRSLKPEYGVMVGICTHLGCIPNFEPLPSDMQASDNWLGGYFCPCHGSKYDLAGRVYSGVPAPYNLPVPPYHFVNATTIRIGANPPNSQFDFSSIKAL